MLMLVTATLLSLGGSVFLALDGPATAAPARNRRVAATLLAMSGTTLLAAIAWAVAGWSSA